MVVDDRDAHVAGAGSLTAAPPGSRTWTWVPRGVVRQQADGAAELGGPLAHRRQPDAGGRAVVDADAVVDDVDLDRRAGGDRQPAAARPGRGARRS